MLILLTAVVSVLLLSLCKSFAMLLWLPQLYFKKGIYDFKVCLPTAILTELSYMLDGTSLTDVISLQYSREDIRFALWSQADQNSIR